MSSAGEGESALAKTIEVLTSIRGVEIHHASAAQNNDRDQSIAPLRLIGAGKAPHNHPPKELAGTPNRRLKDAWVEVHDVGLGYYVE